MNDRERLVLLREEMGKSMKFSPESTANLCNNVLRPAFEQVIVNFSSKSANESKRFLSSIQRTYKDNEGRNPTLPVLTTHAVLLQHIMPLEMAASELFDEGMFYQGIAFFDMAHGAAYAAANFISADNAQQGSTEDPDLLFAVNPETSIGEQAKLYLDAQRRQRAGSSLLAEDPTGFLLADELVLNFRGESTKFDNNVVESPESNESEFSIYGAEFFRKLYKMTYPIVEDFRKPRKGR